MWMTQCMKLRTFETKKRTTSSEQNSRIHTRADRKQLTDAENIALQIAMGLILKLGALVMLNPNLATRRVQGRL